MDQRAAVSTVYVAATFMTVLDTTIVNVASPAIGRSFAVSATQTDAVSVGFLLSLAVFMPASGWLGDRFGGRRILLWAIAVFTAASALCGAAASLPELVAFRVLQGAGGGMLTPVGLAMLFRLYPHGERARVAAVLGTVTTLAPATGPVLGGWLTTVSSWRLVFLINVPIGVAALVFGALFLDHPADVTGGRFDLAGFVLDGLGSALLMFAVTQAPQVGWGSPETAATLTAGIVVTGAAVVLALRRADPLLDLRVLTDPVFGPTTLIMLLVTVTFLGSLFLVSLYYQNVLGMSPLLAGLSTLPQAAGVIIGSQVVRRVLSRRLPPWQHLAAGCAAVAGATALFATLGAHTSPWWPRLFMFLLGLSVSQVFVTAQASAFENITDAQTGRAATLFNSTRQFGGATGIAVLTTIVGALGPDGAPAAGAAGGRLWGFHAAFAVAAVVAAAAGRPALRLGRTRAPVTAAVTEPVAPPSPG
jgi:EmrB/QacA subfamily drug resistance transporter